MGEFDFAGVQMLKADRRQLLVYRDLLFDFAGHIAQANVGHVTHHRFHAISQQ